MAIEISNAIHAMAVIANNDRGGAVFVGQGNVGFAPFGIGPDFSEKLGVGRYRLHMLAPINIVTPGPLVGRGEGLVIAEPLASPIQPEFFTPLASPVSKAIVSVAGLSDILVETISTTTSPVAGSTAFAEVARDVTIGQAPFDDLLNVPIVFAPSGSGRLDVIATASFQASLPGSRLEFQLLLDGTVIGPGAGSGASFTVSSDGGKGSIAIVKRVFGVSPGSHTVRLMWRLIGIESSASILVSNGIEHASLRASEESIAGSDVDDNVTFQVLVLRFPQQSTTG